MKAWAWFMICCSISIWSHVSGKKVLRENQKQKQHEKEVSSSHKKEIEENQSFPDQGVHSSHKHQSKENELSSNEFSFDQLDRRNKKEKRDVFDDEPLYVHHHRRQKTQIPLKKLGLFALGNKPSQGFDHPHRRFFVPPPPLYPWFARPQSAVNFGISPVCCPPVNQQATPFTPGCLPFCVLPPPATSNPFSPPPPVYSSFPQIGQIPVNRHQLSFAPIGAQLPHPFGFGQYPDGGGQYYWSAAVFGPNSPLSPVLGTGGGSVQELQQFQNRPLLLDVKTPFKCYPHENYPQIETNTPPFLPASISYSPLNVDPLMNT